MSALGRSRRACPRPVAHLAQGEGPEKSGDGQSVYGGEVEKIQIGVLRHGHRDDVTGARRPGRKIFASGHGPTIPRPRARVNLNLTRPHGRGIVGSQTKLVNRENEMTQTQTQTPHFCYHCKMAHARGETRCPGGGTFSNAPVPVPSRGMPVDAAREIARIDAEWLAARCLEIHPGGAR